MTLTDAADAGGADVLVDVIIVVVAAGVVVDAAVGGAHKKSLLWEVQRGIERKIDCAKWLIAASVVCSEAISEFVFGCFRFEFERC